METSYVLGQPVPMLSYSDDKTCLFISILNLSCSNSCLVFLVLLACITVKSLPLPSWWPPLNIASCFPLEVSSYLAWTNSVPCLSAPAPSPFWESFSWLLQFVNILQRNSQDWNTVFQMWSNKQRRIITSLGFVAVLLLIQPRKLLTFFGSRVYCWLMFSFLSTNTPRYFQQMNFQLPSWTVPVQLHGFLPSHTQDIKFVVKFCEVPVGLFIPIVPFFIPIV